MQNPQNFKISHIAGPEANQEQRLFASALEKSERKYILLSPNNKGRIPLQGITGMCKATRFAALARAAIARGKPSRSFRQKRLCCFEALARVRP